MSIRGVVLTLATVVACAVLASACGGGSPTTVVTVTATPTGTAEAVDETPLPEEEECVWQESSPGLSKIEYQTKCRDIEYKVLKKDADRLIGRLYRFEGQTFQIMDAGEGQYWTDFGYGLEPQTQILLAVTLDEWGYYDDNVMVLYDTGVNVYEEDVIKVWGECLGSYSYESTAGYNLTVPLLWAKYLQKQ
jgi:hypothetical protein